ncbi:MAG: CmcJ/NvfI family oxidoreductase [Myxococcota bacterium]|nr:CmcJ/NvfI family oxidoreductase [Myxococcota bacterium]
MKVSTIAPTRGRFHYLAASVEHSLHRNGRVLTRRDRDGSDSGFEGVVLDGRELPVLDARRLESDREPGARCNLDTHGFERLTHPLAGGELDFLDDARVVGEYYPDCAQVVKDATGAAQVFAFDHNVRSAQGKRSRTRLRGGQQVQGPAHVVHGDYTLTSAPARLRELARPPSGNDTLRPFLPEGRSLIPPPAVERALAAGGRFGLVNVWRSIVPEPVATHPLALCGARTVEPADLVVFEIHYADRIGENYFAKHAPRHAWYYYPGMEREEILLIKQWDSAGALARSGGAEGDAAAPAGEPCTFSFHSAFVDPGAPPDAPDRWSIEVRCAVLYD